MTVKTTESTYYHSYINTLRILAVLAVITIHASGHVLFDVPRFSVEWWIANIYNSISRFCIPIFIMISGALILSSNYSSTSLFLIKRIKKVALPGLVWVIIYYIVFQALRKQPIDLSYLAKIILKLHNWEGLSYHLWFIPLIIGIYLAAPIVKIFISNATKKMMLYFLILWFFFSIILPFIKTIFGINIGIEQTIFVLYIGYFILGYFLHHSEFKIHSIVSILLFLFCSIVTSVWIFYLSSKAGKTVTYPLGYETPNVMLMSVSIFLLVKNINTQVFDSSFLKNVGDAVFGIFLIHILFLDPLLRAYNRLFNPVEKMGPLFGIPISILIVFFLSLLVVTLLKRFPVTRHTI
jgi:surface polysaccharide O-acyltransferase-like enzyme